VSNWRLAGFDKLHLSPGETRRISMTVDPRLIARFEEGRGWRLDGGSYALAIGHHAGDATLKGVAKLDSLSLKP
jgi:beta-glucosidase